MQIKNIIILFISFQIAKAAETDCVKSGGKTGEECNGKKTFVNMEEWNFIYEEDQAYVCCFYKGKIGINDYEGCFPFYADYILNNKINNLLNEIEKGNWEFALGIPYNNPSINCSSEIPNFYCFLVVISFLVMLIS